VPKSVTYYLKDLIKINHFSKKRVVHSINTDHTQEGVRTEVRVSVVIQNEQINKDKLLITDMI
jgi:hypothetical protein